VCVHHPLHPRFAGDPAESRLSRTPAPAKPSQQPCLSTRSVAAEAASSAIRCACFSIRPASSCFGKSFDSDSSNHEAPSPSGGGHRHWLGTPRAGAPKSARVSPAAPQAPLPARSVPSSSAPLSPFRACSQFRKRKRRCFRAMMMRLRLQRKQPVSRREVRVRER